MANSVTKASFKDLCSYFPSDGDNISRMIDAAFASLTPAEKLADNLLLYTFPAISTTKQEIDDDPGARPILIAARAYAAATGGWIHLHNADADNVTEGVNADFVLPITNTANEMSWCVVGGASFKRYWVTGLTISSSTLVETSVAISIPPDVWVLYTGS
jgi:hypothetical protein